MVAIQLGDSIALVVLAVWSWMVTVTLLVRLIRGRRYPPCRWGGVVGGRGGYCPFFEPSKKTCSFKPSGGCLYDTFARSEPSPSDAR